MSGAAGISATISQTALLKVSGEIVSSFSHAMICGSARRANAAQKLNAKRQASTNWWICVLI
jgi:hypothetical protein